MSLIPQNKSAVVRSFNNEFQRLFDRFFDNEHDIKRTLSSFDWVPSVDVVEKEKIYLVKVNLPGVDPKDVDIQAEDGMLAIRAESSYGSFYRSFSLPNGVGIDDIKASSKNGVVEIEIPKGKNSMPKKIQINH